IWASSATTKPRRVIRRRPFATGAPAMITVTGSRRSPCFHVAISLKGSRSCFPDDPFGPWSPPTGLVFSCTRLARLLAADGPKLGQGCRPDLSIGAQDERLAAELDRAQPAGAYLLIRRLTADPIRITKVFERQSKGVHVQFASMFAVVVA